MGSTSGINSKKTRPKWTGREKEEREETNENVRDIAQETLSGLTSYNYFKHNSIKILLYYIYTYEKINSNIILGIVLNVTLKKLNVNILFYFGLL